MIRSGMIFKIYRCGIGAVGGAKPMQFSGQACKYTSTAETLANQFESSIWVAVLSV